MPKYLLLTSYTAEGAKGVLKSGGTARRKAAEHAVASVGGKIEAFYFAFGDEDAIIIVDYPDHASASAVALAVAATGAVQTRTTVLITPEEVDEAVKKPVAYRPPGS
jgi:uncharacterized protein with GYD domain